MHYRDYLFAISGLDGESQLGRVVRARQNKDPKTKTDWEVKEKYKWNKHLEEVRIAYLDTLTDEEREAFFKQEIAEKKALFNH